MRDVPHTLPSKTRTTPAYFHGRRAFADGAAIGDNPYPKGISRSSWYAGFLDCRMVQRLGHIFAKYKMEWP